MAAGAADSESHGEQSLSLPAAQFAKLSPVSFLAAHLPSTRPSGRSPAQARPPSINANSLTHAHGSAVVRVGDTAVVCGVRGEILHAEDSNAASLFQGSSAYGPRPDTMDGDAIAELDLLIPNIELSTGCNPQHMPGNPPSTLAQSLTQRALTLLRISNLVAFEDLQIWARSLDGETVTGSDSDSSAEVNEDRPKARKDASDESPLPPKVMAYWALYIDVLVMSLDGSAFDTIWAAILAALRNTRLPTAWWDHDLEQVLCDPSREMGRQLQLRGCPIACSFAALDPPLRIGSKRTSGEDVQVLVDPDDFEEGCCSQCITVVVDHDGQRILKLEMEGNGLLDPASLRKLMRRAGQRWEEWKFVLDTT